MLNAPSIIDGKPLVTTASVGVSLYPRDGEDVGSLLRHSDTAMYQAKDRGRNNFQVFSPVMDRQLKERVAIDDFGTGYSSLSYLKRWRVDYLKIDRSFIRDLVTDSNDHAIVGAIIAMAQHLRIKVIAEGVEGWPQLEMLRKLGCRYAQGYLFAEPAPAAKCREFLNGRPLGLADVETDLLKAAGG